MCTRNGACVDVGECGEYYEGRAITETWSGTGRRNTRRHASKYTQTMHFWSHATLLNEVIYTWIYQTLATYPRPFNVPHFSNHSSPRKVTFDYIKHTLHLHDGMFNMMFVSVNILGDNLFIATSILGCAVIQAVSRRLPNEAARGSSPGQVMCDCGEHSCFEAVYTVYTYMSIIWFRHWKVDRRHSMEFS